MTLREASRRIDSILYSAAGKVPLSADLHCGKIARKAPASPWIRAAFAVVALISLFYWLPALAVDPSQPDVIGHPFNPDGYYPSVLWVALGWYPVFVLYFWLPGALGRFRTDYAAVVPRQVSEKAPLVRSWHFVAAAAIGLPLILGFEFAIVGDNEPLWFEELGAAGWFFWFVPNFLPALFAIAGFIHVREALEAYRQDISDGVAVDPFDADRAGGLSPIGDMFLRLGLFAAAMGMWLVWFSAAVLVVPEFRMEFEINPAFVVFVTVLWSLYAWLVWYLVLRPTRWTQKAMAQQLELTLAKITALYAKTVDASADDNQVDPSIDEKLNRLEARIARIKNIYPINPYRPRLWLGVRLTTLTPLIVAAAPYAIRIGQAGLTFEAG